MGDRKVMDCSKTPSDTNCTLKSSGKEEEVMAAAIHHAVTVHGHEDTLEFRKQLQSMLEDE
jgi:predicted small metal-binding protein